MNRNWEEEIDVPVGADNGFAPGAADQGQPTHFLPRRNRIVFRVPVPKTFTEKDELVWTLTTYGKVEKAYATLRPDYLVDDVVPRLGDRCAWRRNEQPGSSRQQAADRQDRGLQER